MGIVVSRKWRGACSALRWAEGRYHCGVLAGARQPWVRRLLARWIGAGIGCDASLEREDVPG